MKRATATTTTNPVLISFEYFTSVLSTSHKVNIMAGFKDKNSGNRHFSKKTAQQKEYQKLPDFILSISTHSEKSESEIAIMI
jgi:hypothetical protein